MLGEDGIEGDILGDAPKRDVGNGLVVEAAGGTSRFVTKFVLVEGGGENALAGDSEGDAGGVGSDPTTTPLLGNDSCSSTSACWVKN